MTVATPFDPFVSSVYVSRSPSGSAALKVPFIDLSSCVVSVPPFATGGRLAAIVTVTVATFEASVPSLTENVNVSVPLVPLPAV